MKMVKDESIIIDISIKFRYNKPIYKGIVFVEV